MRTRLLALLLVVTAAPAFARHANTTTQSCEQKCVETKDECGNVCTQYAGGKGASMCKKGCNEGAKKCEDKCKKKK